MSAHDGVSRSELERLKRELSEMRKAAGLPEPVKAEHHPKEVYASATLVESMERLHGVLDKLLKLFENANREVYDGYERGLKDTDAKLEQVIMQNEKIARGVVALADMMKQRPAQQPRAPMPLPQPQIQPVQEDTIPPPPRFEPTPMPSLSFGASGQKTPQFDEESFMRQPVTQLSPQAQSTPPPIVTRPVIPTLSPPPGLGSQADSMATLPPLQNSLASSDTAQMPTRPGLGDLPPPPPPPSNAGRRTLLDKFSFK